MPRKLIAIVLAAALAVPAVGAAPASAGNARDIAPFIVGAAALAVIATAVQAAHKKDRKARRDRKARHHRERREVSRWRHLRHERYRHQRHERRQVAVPSYCRSTHRSWRGTRAIYDLDCMRRNYAQVSRLPQGCLVRIPTRYGIRRGYGALCLRENGGWGAR